jgi:hypothetical protein
VRAIDYSEICEGVRELVRWLNDHGFETTDSGDGSHHAAGMEGAMPCPMVAMVVDQPDRKLVDEADRLFALVGDRGIHCPHIQASYDPCDGSGILLLTNVTSEMLGL